ncbi:MAG: TIM barrel protein [Rubrobacteraceae bacterium]
MARFRYSYVISGSSAEEISDRIDRLASLGYDAVELGAELPLAEASEARYLIDDAGLSVSSICPSFTAERDLSHPDQEVRETAVRYLVEVAQLAAAAAPVIIVAPTAFLRTQPIASESEEWDLTVESIRAAGKHAASLGVDLTLECWNRYGTFLLNRLEQSARLWRDTELSNGGILADTYHMNIEERSLPEAIGTAGTSINHVHLSDSNRAAPGLGHVDFGSVLQALVEVGYPGYLTFELDARAAVRSGVVPAEEREDPTSYLMEMGIKHLRNLASLL